MIHDRLLYRMISPFGILGPLVRGGSRRALAIVVTGALLSACGGDVSEQELQSLRDQVAELQKTQADIQKKLVNLDKLVKTNVGERIAKAMRPKRPDPDIVYKVRVGRSPIRGSRDAPVTVVEWADFQCPYCAAAAKLSAELVAAYPDDVRFVFKNYPLARHPMAKLAAKAAYAAQQQGKFWEMHDLIYAGDVNQLKIETLRGYAQSLGLDMERFEEDLNSTQAERAISADKQQARFLSVGGTPTYFVNGKVVTNRSPAGVRALVADEIAKSKRKASSS